MNCSLDPTCEASTSNFTYESQAVMAIKMTMLTFSLLVALPTHCYVLWLILRGTGSRVASEFFHLNLSVCGIVFSLYALVSLLRMIFRLQESALFSTEMFLSGNMITTQPLFQSLICVERYLAVVHPVTFLKFKPLRYKLVCSAAVWVMGLGSCVFCIFFVAKNNVIFMWYSFLQFFLFFSIQLFCLVAVLRALKQSGPGDRRREEENHMKRRAFYVIFKSVMTMLIIFVPFICTGFFYILLQRDASMFIIFSLYSLVLGSFVPALRYLQRTGKLPFIKPS